MPDEFVDSEENQVDFSTHTVEEEGDDDAEGLGIHEDVEMDGEPKEEDEEFSMMMNEFSEYTEM